MVSFLGLIITRPDKGSGVVILNHYDYVDKMTTILNDISKFIKLGPFDSYDSTVTLENRFQRKLIKWAKSGVLSDIVKLGLWALFNHVYMFRLKSIREVLH